MTPDPNRPRSEPKSYDPEYARALGMSEKTRLEFAAGDYYTMDQILRTIEDEYGTGEDEPSRPDPKPRPES